MSEGVGVLIPLDLLVLFLHDAIAQKFLLLLPLHYLPGMLFLLPLSVIFLVSFFFPSCPESLLLCDNSLHS